MISLLVGSFVGWACATAPGGTGPTAGAAVIADAPTWSAYGLTVTRPPDWTFVAADQSLAPDTVIMLLGPIGDHALAPVVEIGRRPLSAFDRRIQPERILAATTVEFMQLLHSFAADSEPQALELGGLPTSMMRAQITEMLPNGELEGRLARFYATVHVDQVWLVRCLGPQDGAADTAFDAIVGSLAFTVP